MPRKRVRRCVGASPNYLAGIFDDLRITAFFTGRAFAFAANYL